jgi:hypothetical protein
MSSQEKIARGSRYDPVLLYSSGSCTKVYSPALRGPEPRLFCATLKSKKPTNSNGVIEDSDLAAEQL